MIRTPDDLLSAYRAGGISRGEVANLALEVVDDGSVDRVMQQLSPRIRELTVELAKVLAGRSQQDLDALEWTGRGPAARPSAVAIAAVVRWASVHADSNAAE